MNETGHTFSPVSALFPASMVVWSLLGTGVLGCDAQQAQGRHDGEAGHPSVPVVRPSTPKTASPPVPPRSSETPGDDVVAVPIPEESVDPAPPRAPGPWKLIRAGAYLMGSPPDEPGREDDERQHRVTLTHDFWIQATEVTQNQWKRIMGGNPSRFPGCGGECPVEMVDWFDAVSYCNKLSSMEGLPECYHLDHCTIDASNALGCASVQFAGMECRGYRLPTEAEWEYAARAGTSTAIYTGAIDIVSQHFSPSLNPISWYSGNCEVAYFVPYFGKKRDLGRRKVCGPHRVMRKRPNAWGLYDMLGNVWEWCHDWHGPYSNDAEIDPVGLQSGTNRVVRGGSFEDSAWSIRAAERFELPPESSLATQGFRPARTSR